MKAERESGKWGEKKENAKRVFLIGTESERLLRGNELFTRIIFPCVGSSLNFGLDDTSCIVAGCQCSIDVLCVG